MTWETYAQTCKYLKIKPTKANWRAHLRREFAELKQTMKEAGVKP